VTTGAGGGAVNSALDSYTPLGGLVPMVLIQLGALTYIPALALGPIAEHLHRTAAVGRLMPSVYVDAHGQICACKINWTRRRG
jgi:K+-transporting ATPase A subunit